MSDKARFIARFVLVLLVSSTSYMVALDDPFGKAALLGALNAAVIALLELIGPTSKVGLEWKKPDT